MRSANMRAAAFESANRFYLKKHVCFFVLCISLSARLTDGAKKFMGFASNTPYFHYESQEERKVPSGCKVVHINFLARHGTRHPSIREVKEMNTMVQLINQLHTNQGDFAFNKVKFPWLNPFTDHHHKSLTDRGGEEFYNMSKRMRRRYAEFFNGHLSSDEFRFISTKTSRSMKSAMAFAIGLLEGTGKLTTCGIRPVDIESNDVHNDTVLRCFDVCPKYIKTVSKNKQSLVEHHDFKFTQHMNDVVEYVKHQFGNSSKIMAKHVIGMFLACAFENAVFDRDDAWCSVFRPKDMDIMEYYYDLKNFWKRGWGHDINHEISCPLLSAIVTDIKSSLNINNAHSKAGVFRFAHSETIQRLYCLLGLFKDREMLRANNYHRHTNRYYRTSSISPFAANIAFVIYNCSGDGFTKEEDIQVEVLVNEVPISVPCCDSGTLCSWQRFLQCFDGIVKNCDLEMTCHLSDQDHEHIGYHEEHIEL